MTSPAQWLALVRRLASLAYGCRVDTERGVPSGRTDRRSTAGQGRAAAMRVASFGWRRRVVGSGRLKRGRLSSSWLIGCDESGSGSGVPGAEGDKAEDPERRVEDEHDWARQMDPAWIETAAKVGHHPHAIRLPPICLPILRTIHREGTSRSIREPMVPSGFGVLMLGGFGFGRSG